MLSTAITNREKGLPGSAATVNDLFKSLRESENKALNVGNLTSDKMTTGEIISTQKYGAEAALRILELKITESGKTFEELSEDLKKANPDAFFQLTEELAQTSPEYIEKLKELAKATDPADQEAIRGQLKDLREKYARVALAAKSNEIIEKRRAAEAAKIVKEIDKTLDIYRRANAYADRYSAALERLVKVTEARVNDFSNAPKVQDINRQNEEVLGNLSAFSFQEVRAAAGSVAGLAGGGPEAKALADQAVASKILADQLPALIKSTDIADRGSIVGNLSGLFAAQGINIETPEIKKVLTDIQNRLKESASDTDTDKLTKELEETVMGAIVTGKQIGRAHV